MATPSLSQPYFAVYGTFDSRPHLFEEPVARSLQAGDITSIDGHFVRMVVNHNGQRLTCYDCHEQVRAALERRREATMAR